MEKTGLLSEVKSRTAVDYVLRTTQQNHVQLSAMADQKASILMGVQAVILTMLFGHIRQGDTNLWIWLLGSSTLLSVIFSLISILPSYRKRSGRPNWLFFSSFAKLEPDEYMSQMARILESDEEIYKTIITDIHQLGGVLYKKKYRYLQVSYIIFLMGFVIAFFMVVLQRVMGV